MTTNAHRLVAFALGVSTMVVMSGFLLVAAPPQAVGTWEVIGTTDPSSARSGAATATLADGSTFVAGGRLGDGTVTDSVVVYDPLTNASTTVGHLLSPRVNAAAARLDDGRVFVVGGEVGALLIADAEIFDPSTGTSVIVGAMAQPRTRHAVARLADGRVLIVGGATVDDVALASVEIFDPETFGMLPAGSMAVPRVGATATLLIDNRVLVVGGNSGNGTPDLASAELYHPFSNEFVPVDTQLSVARSGHTATLLPHNGAVLVAGGTAAGVPVTDVDLFLPAMFPDPYSWSIGTFAPAQPLFNPRSQAVSGPAGDDGYAFVAGGGVPVGEAYAFTTLKTDKDDYAPGERALITGSGWQPGEEVRLVFQEDPAVHPDYTLTLTADGEGNISHDEWAPEEHDLNVRFYLMATGQLSHRQAQMTFTDGNLDAVTLSLRKSDCTTASTSFATGDTACVHSVVSVGGGGTNPDYYVLWFNPSSILTFTDTHLSVPNGQVLDDSHSVAIAGTWTVKACKNTGCSGGNLVTSSTFSVAAAVNTTTSVSSSSNPSTYGSSVSFTATVTPASGVAAPSGSVQFVVDGSNFGSPVTLLPSGTNGVGTSGATTTLNVAASPHSVTAVYTPTGGFSGSNGTLAGGQVIQKATPTATLAVSNSPQTYTGFGQAATVSVTTSSVPGAASNVLTGGAATKTTAGTYAVTADFVPTDTTNYNSLLGLVAGNFVIQKATPTATLAVSNSPQTYTGAGQAATVTVSASSVPGAASNVLTGGAATKTTAGTYAVTADFVPTDTVNYNSLLGLAAGDFVIEKATPTATLAVSNSPQTYTGFGQAATVSVTTSSVPGAASNVLTGGAATKTTAGTYAVTADFVPTDTTNYNSLLGLAAGNFVIQKATPTATLAVSNSPKTYTGAGQAATVTVSASSVPGAASNVLTGGAATQTNAGTYAVTADFVPTDTTNYNSLLGLAAGNFVIQKATPTATLAVSNSPQTYTGSGQAATVTVSASSVPGAVANVLTGGLATQTNAGTYAVTADFVPTDTTNYNSLLGLAAGNFVIDKATPTATLAVSNSPQTYTGSGQAATVGITVSSVSGAVANVLTGGLATQTNAATYAVTADFVPTDTTNYNSLLGLAAGNFVIDKATPTATLAVSNSPQTYTGSGQAATVGITVSSVSGAVANVLTGGLATQTNAGTYAVTADFVPADTTNYNSLLGLAAGNFVIEKATPTATLAVSNSPQTYTGAGQAATVSVTTSSVPGAASNVLTGGAATQTNAGTYAVTADFVPTDTTNYKSLLGLAAGNFVIQKATPTATLGVTNSPQTYNGTGQAATVGITASSVSGAVANVLTGGLAAQTNAGTYAVTADFVPTDTTNYNSLLGLAAGNFVIEKVTPTATLVVSNSPQTYTGFGQAATVTVSASSVPGAASNVLTGGAATKTTAGTYAVTADFVPTDTTNYNSLLGLAAGNFVIQKATPTATLAVSNSPKTYTGAGQAATVSVTTSSVPGAASNVLTGGAATKTTAGTYAVTADFVPTDTTNYNSLLGLAAGNFVIEKATPTATLAVTNSPQTYTGSPQAATVGISAQSVPGAVANVLTGGAATKTNVGTYAVTANFVPTDTVNYNSLLGLAAGDFKIIYGWDGFLQPINDTAHQTGVSQSKFKLGQTIPAKFVLKNANGVVVQQATSPIFTRSGNRGACAATDSETAFTVDPDADATFKWDGAQYHYNWSTKGLTAGVYRIYANLADGEVPFVDICLQK